MQRAVAMSVTSSPIEASRDFSFAQRSIISEQGSAGRETGHADAINNTVGLRTIFVLFTSIWP